MEFNLAVNFSAHNLEKSVRIVLLISIGITSLNDGFFFILRGFLSVLGFILVFLVGLLPSQQALTCPKPTIQTLEKGLKHVPS